MSELLDDQVQVLDQVLPLRTVSLCSGVGGLEQGVAQLVPIELLAYAEVDPDASRVMAHHNPGVPNLGDVKSIDWSRVARRGELELLTAGYPCQPFSVAGRRKGIDDERHLYPYISDAIRTLRPRLVFLENVPGHRSKGFAEVLADLTESGYRVAWCSVRASDCGLPHRRERLFILAVATDTDGTIIWKEQESVSGSGNTSLARRDREAAPDTYGGGRRASGHAEQARRTGVHAVGDAASPNSEVVRWGSWSGVSVGIAAGQSESPGGGSRTASDPRGEGLQGSERTFAAPQEVSESPDDHSFVDWKDYTAAIRRWERVRGSVAPYPIGYGPRGGRRVSNEFGEWIMGYPAGWISSVPGISLRAGAKLYGNGVVPQAAARAFELNCRALVEFDG